MASKPRFFKYPTWPECAIAGIKDWTVDEIRTSLENLGLEDTFVITPRPKHPDSVYVTFRTTEDRDRVSKLNALEQNGKRLFVRIDSNNWPTKYGNSTKEKNAPPELKISNAFQCLGEEFE